MPPRSKKTTDPSLPPLRYRLRRSVNRAEKDQALILILNYPLKVIKLKKTWSSVMDTLDNDQFVPIESIVNLSSETAPLAVERFLDDLVVKGYVEREGVVDLDTFPKVSIIIPVKNRPEEIKTCVESLQKLDYPADRVEIIVVDDASTDDTLSVIRQYPVTVIQMETNQQAPFCRNQAAKAAQGEILAFIDSDCIAATDWLIQLLPHFRFSEITAVGGFVDAYFDQQNLDKYEKTQSSLNMGKRFRATSQNDPFFYVPSCNLLVRKEIFDQLDGFSKDLIVGEDVDFCWRLQDSGHRLWYLPLGTIYHKHRNQIKSFCKRRFEYGTSEPLLQKRHTTRPKRMTTPLGAISIVFLLALAIGLETPVITTLILFPFAWDLLKKVRQVNQLNINISGFIIARSLARGYLAFYYHICSFISRYYLIWLGIAAIWIPQIALIFGLAHLITGIVEFRLKKPSLNFLAYFLFFTLEQIAYQCGVWWGCLKYGKFTPVFPVPKLI